MRSYGITHVQTDVGNVMLPTLVRWYAAFYKLMIVASTEIFQNCWGIFVAGSSSVAAAWVLLLIRQPIRHGRCRRWLNLIPQSNFGRSVGNQNHTK